MSPADSALTIRARMTRMFGGGMDGQGIAHEGIDLRNRQPGHDSEDGGVAAEPPVWEYHDPSLPALTLIVQHL